MSFSKKIVTTYSKSLFQSLLKSLPPELNESAIKSENFNGEISKEINEEISEEETKEIQKFDLSRIISKTEKQAENSTTIYTVAEELNLISAFIKSAKEIEILFNNPTLPEQRKLKVILDLFPGLSLITCSFLKVLTEKINLGLIPEISAEYQELLLKFKRTTKVKLITATLLEESYGAFLLDVLKKLTNSNEVILEISYNPKLLGGFILEYNSIAIDASLLKEFGLFFYEI
jgi:ATP synthase F1 delta subunit